MAKNEAKIKFTAETGEFNKAIQKSNAEMSELRAELKLNEAQMKTTGETVDGLEKKHDLLQKQLETSRGKTDALSQKVAKAAEIFGDNSLEVTKLKTQLANAQTAEEKLKQEIKQCTDAIEAQGKEVENLGDSMDDAKTATDKLTDEIEAQQTELDQLKKKYSDYVLEGQKSSKEAKTLAKNIKSLSGDLADNKAKMGQAESAASKLDKSMDDAGDAARNSGDGFNLASGAISDLVSKGLEKAIGKISEFIGYLAELPEATREIRQDMATLDTSFERSGFTTEQATQTWKDLYTVFGEDDRAVETANHIAKIAKNQEDLNSWVTITQGIWGTYQDSLPVEGLAEAANETIKTGTVTGGLADAMNWSSEAAQMFSQYMGGDVVTAEDAFNVALSECTTEQERQQLITETLTALYGDAAESYKEASGAQLEAKEASAEHLLVQNQLADAAEPLATAWQGLKTDILEGLLPAVQAFSDWGQGAIGWMKEHPVLMDALGAALAVVGAALTAITVAVTAYTVAQWAMNSAVLACPVTWIIVAIVAAVAALAAVIVLVIKYWDEIQAAAIKAWEAIKNAFATAAEWFNTNVVQPVVNFFVGLWESISGAAVACWEAVSGAFIAAGEWFNTNVIQPIVNFFKGLWESIKSIWDTICNVVEVAIMAIGSILSAAFDIITLPFQFIWENCKEYVFAAWDWIKEKVTSAIDAIKNTIEKVWNGIKEFFSPILEGIKETFSNIWNAIKTTVTKAVDAIKTKVTTIWNNIKSVTSTVWNGIKSFVSTVWNGIKDVVTKAINAVKEKVSSIWNGIKTTTSNVWNGIKSTVSNIVNGVKNTVSNVFNAVKSTVTNVWNNIKSAITKPIEEAKNKVKSAIDAIKGFFSNLKLKLPDIKLPHFKLTGSFSLNPPSVPKLSIDWYKDGGVMTRPTIFGMNGMRFMGGGEAGKEAIAPIDTLQSYISDAVEKATSVVNLEALADAIEDIANRPVQLNINGRRFAYATAGDTDMVGGQRTSLQNRGLIMD